MPGTVGLAVPPSEALRQADKRGSNLHADYITAGMQTQINKSLGKEGYCSHLLGYSAENNSESRKPLGRIVLCKVQKSFPLPSLPPLKVASQAEERRPGRRGREGRFLPILPFAREAQPLHIVPLAHSRLCSSASTWL